MKEKRIGSQVLTVKDYYCSNDGRTYPARQDGKLWLYVNLTTMCNGKCPFCINPEVGGGNKKLDPASFAEVLFRIKDHIYGISLTGGEPMLDPELANVVIDIIRSVCGDDMQIDIVTNGTGFSEILETLDIKQLDAVHLSRHRISDADNDRIFGFQTAASADIAAVISKMSDPAKFVLNCVLMAGGVDCAQKAAAYLDYASELGARNVCFIGLGKINEFCEAHYIDPGKLDLYRNPAFHQWNHYCDHAYCSCSNGSYDAAAGSIRFYYRRIGDRRAPYARQLVYMADGRLLAGFSGREIRFDEKQ